MKSNVHHLRLVNGDQIITKIIKKTKNSTYAENPLLIEEIKNPDSGQSSILLTKYLLNESDNVTLSNTHIVSSTVVSKQIEKYYLVSLEYNKKYIENNKISEIEKITKFMYGLVTKNPTETSLVVKRNDIDLSRVSLGSNTIN